MSNEQKLGQEPAFPTDNFPYETTFTGEISGQEIPTIEFKTMPGMSKRFYAACSIMQGMLANIDFLIKNAECAKNNGIDPDVFLIKTTYSLVDELLKQENI